MTAQYICWQPLLTDHQAYTYAALRLEVNGGLVVNLGRLHDPLRAAQGWVSVGGADIDKRLIPSRGWRRWAREELDRYPDAVHLFGSPFEQFRQIQIMAMACRLGRKVALISEPFSTSSAGYLADGGRALGWLKAKLRPLLYRAYGYRFGSKIDAVFAISPLACRQYAAFGVPSARIFPFGYFVPGQIDANSPRPNRIVGELRLVFVASLIARKGLAIAIDAVRRARAEGSKVTLDVYGSGPQDRYEFSDGVVYKGVIPFGRAGEMIANYDALVLPSLFDGWAVVVNEALQAGTPVLCSDAVGASAVVKAHKVGEVFPSGDTAELARILQDWSQVPSRLAAARTRVSEIAPLLDPAIAASYLHRAMAAVNGNGERPISPWYSWPGEYCK